LVDSFEFESRQNHQKNLYVPEYGRSNSQHDNSGAAGQCIITLFKWTQSAFMTKGSRR
jgi:hypothetical protein